MPKSNEKENEVIVEEIKEMAETAAEVSAESEVKTEAPEQPVKPKRKYTRRAKKDAKAETTASVKAEEKPRRGRRPKKTEDATPSISSRKAAGKLAPTKSAEVVPELFIQEDGFEISYIAVISQVKRVVTGGYSSLKIYLNIKERRVYVVVDEKININFPLE